MDQRGGGAPVSRADSNQVEVRGAPVLDERGAGVPAESPVELLDVGFALLAGGDQVRLLSLLGLEAHEVSRGLRAAERAAESREDPDAAADVTREPALTGVDQLAKAWWCTAVGTDTEGPAPLREMGPASREVSVE